MHVIKSFKRICYRRLLAKSSRCYSLCRLLVAIIFLCLICSVFLLFYYSILVFHLNYCCYRSSNLIVSLTTTSARFNYELPLTIHSLLTQTRLPKEIRIYLSPIINNSEQKTLTREYLKMYVKSVDSSRIIGRLFDQLVQIRWEEQDYGPATKFLPIIKEFHSMPSNHSQSQPIMICDDDHYYQPYTIDALERYSNQYRHSIVGFRGWRIRQDLVWGVGDDEFSYHIIASHRISEMYRVGVVTANNAYVIRPFFFDSHLYDDFNSVAADIRRVDDIWLNGHAAKRQIARFVIPACCVSVSVTRTHELENYFHTHQMTRSQANDHALRWFNQSWEKDFWYRFKGENQPKYSHGLVRIAREWMNFIVRLKFITYCGFI